MSQNNGGRVVAMVTILALVGAALVFMVGMTEEARSAHDPTPVFGIVAAGALFAFLLRGPVGRALAKMLEGAPVADDTMRERIEALEGQVNELNFDQHRVLELEERLDFAERLLAQRDPQQALPPQER